VRVSEFLDSRRGKMFGVAEVAALAGSCFILALVLLSYLYFLVPARSRSFAEQRSEAVANEPANARQVLQGRQNTKQTVDSITTSLNDFETRHLLRADQGRLDLYEELNQLIVKNGLRNTSGPTYTTLDPSGTKSTSGKTVSTKWQSFYPGIAVMVTVEGEYQNVRRFIRDVERSRQFVVINEVELQRASQNNAPAPVEEGGGVAAGSGTRGSLVTLQLNMATYFQRQRATTLRQSGITNDATGRSKQTRREEETDFAAALGFGAILVLWWALFGFGSNTPPPSSRGDPTPQPRNTPRHAASAGAGAGGVQDLASIAPVVYEPRRTMLRKRSETSLLTTSRQ
jgi:Tfp pilus assembly protein PilO